MNALSAPIERVVEEHLVSACRAHRLLCLKITSPGRRSVPDRLIMGHDNRSDPVLLFVELKRPGSLPRAGQKAMFARMRAHGAHVVVADSIATVDHLLDDYFLRTPRPISLRDPRTAPLPGKPATLLILGSPDSAAAPTTKKVNAPT